MATRSYFGHEGVLNFGIGETSGGVVDQEDRPVTRAIARSAGDDSRVDGKVLIRRFVSRDQSGPWDRTSEANPCIVQDLSSIRNLELLQNKELGLLWGSNIWGTGPGVLILPIPWYFVAEAGIWQEPSFGNSRASVFARQCPMR